LVKNERFLIHDLIYQVYSLAFAPDGRTLATGGYDGSLQLWVLAHGKVA
jgi:WD40 repeat protein